MLQELTKYLNIGRRVSSFVACKEDYRLLNSLVLFHTQTLSLYFFILSLELWTYVSSASHHTVFEQ